MKFVPNVCFSVILPVTMLDVRSSTVPEISVFIDPWYLGEFSALNRATVSSPIRWEFKRISGVAVGVLIAPVNLRHSSLRLT